MSFLIKVLVQLPDGSFKKLPVARYINGEPQSIKQPTKKEAREWAESFLSQRIEIIDDSTESSVDNSSR